MKALRNGGKRRRSPRELALIEACRRLRPLEPICVSTEINSSAVSPPFPTIGKGHPQAAQKPRWTAIFVSMPDKPVPVIRDTTAELYHQAGTGPVCLKAGHKPWRLDCLAEEAGRCEPVRGHPAPVESSNSGHSLLLREAQALQSYTKRLLLVMSAAMACPSGRVGEQLERHADKHRFPMRIRPGDRPPVRRSANRPLMWNCCRH